MAKNYEISLSISPAAAPPRGPGIWAMPPSIITHPAFKILMTAQIQAFMLACPLSAAVSRAVRWDQLKAHIQDVARVYCSTFHAERTRQLRALRVQAGHARTAYLADPASQPALDQLRCTAADLQHHRQQQAARDALRAGVLLHEYGDQSTYYFHHLHTLRQQATIMSSLQQQPNSPWQICAPKLTDDRLTPSFFFFFFFGLQDSCLFLSSKKAFRTLDEPEIRRNNGPVCMQ